MAVLLNVKSLRLRLGWTQSDLARRLNCQVALIATWEAGLGEPDARVCGELELLVSQADACAFELQSTPKAENFCDKRALGQIHIFGLEDADKKN